MDRRFQGGAVAQAGQFRQADAEVAVGATRQRFIEHAGFEQRAQAHHQVAALNSGIADQEIRDVERPGRHLQERLGGLPDPPEGRRHHVEIVSLDGSDATLQMARVPAVVVVKDRDVELPGIAACPQQVIQAGIPRAGRALGAAVAKKVRRDPDRPPVPHCPLRPRGSVVLSRIVDNDGPGREPELARDGRKSPTLEQGGPIGGGDKDRHRGVLKV